MASLREVFELVREQGGHGDPVGLLRDAGHTDLPEPLLALAIVNFADTLPAAAAEHLAGFVVPHSGVLEGADPADPSATGGLDLLASSPGGLEAEPADLDGVAVEPPIEPLEEAPAAAHLVDAGFGGGADGLDFGAGDPGHGDAAGPAARPEPAGDLGSTVPVELGTAELGTAEPDAADPGAVDPDAGVRGDRGPADPAGPGDADSPGNDRPGNDGPDEAGAGG